MPIHINRQIYVYLRVLIRIYICCDSLCRWLLWSPIKAVFCACEQVDWLHDVAFCVYVSTSTSILPYCKNTLWHSHTRTHLQSPLHPIISSVTYHFACTSRPPCRSFGVSRHFLSFFLIFLCIPSLRENPKLIYLAGTIIVASFLKKTRDRRLVSPYRKSR